MRKLTALFVASTALGAANFGPCRRHHYLSTG